MGSTTTLIICASITLTTVLALEPVVRTHFLPHGAVCTHAPTKCARGLSCDGKGSVKKCIVYKPAGMRCPAWENFWICQPGLACENEVCKIPHGRVCTNSPTQCARGLTCDGKGSVKKCIVYKQPGMRCPARENFWICQPGLKCQNDVCKIPAHRVCTANPTQCASGTTCDGKRSTKRCIVYKQPGMRCPSREDFWICRPGLTCQRDVCKIPLNGSCRSARTQCVAGATCNGSICVLKPRSLGQSCDKTFKCQRGLSCDGKCKLPKKSPCAHHPTLCVSGTKCAGPRFRKLCMPVRGVNEICSDIGYFPCKDGLSCVGRRCVRGTVPRGQPCRNPHEVCRAPLVCGGPAHHRICVKPMQKGEFCKGDPYWKCAPGLRCLDRYCHEY